MQYLISRFRGVQPAMQEQQALQAPRVPRVQPAQQEQRAQ